MPNGKTIWLCPEHQQIDRVTMLSNDVVISRQPLADRVESDRMLQHIKDNQDYMARCKGYWPQVQTGKW